MPKTSRVVCRQCGAPLGIVLNDRLTVEGHRVDVGPHGALTITCMTCKSVRVWETRKSA
jgi:RNase P subunit RPR2